MQVKSKNLLSDKDSIIKAQEIILTEYNKCTNMQNHNIVGKITTVYNPDAYYRDEVRHVFYQIADLTSFLEEGEFESAQT